MNEEAETMNLSNLINGAFGPDDIASSMTDLRIRGTKLLNMKLTSPTNPSTPVANENKEKIKVSIPNSIDIKLQPHSSEINSIQFSNEGSLLASGSTDKKVNLYNTQNGKLLTTFTGALQSMMYVEFNSTDDYLLGTSNDNSVRIWNLNNYKLKDTLTGHIGKIYSAKFSKDSTKILSGSHDRTLKLWDLNRSICVRTIFTFSSCNDVCFIDSDGTNVASGHLDHSIRIWDMKTSNCIKELTGIHSGQVTSLSVSPDGTKLLSNSRDNCLKIWDLRNYQVLFNLEAEGYKVPLNWSKACFSPDGRFVSSGSSDGTIYHWNTLDGQLEISHTFHNYPICSISWNPQGHQIASVDKERNLYLWKDNQKNSKDSIEDYYS
ncbi:WD40 repeat-like protein [Neoconidiobolus thromboides FSU 785]|nr:WD40 repeat-like protein [Neoconidiobolus thromboides FSU 785]